MEILMEHINSNFDIKRTASLGRNLLIDELNIRNIIFYVYLASLLLSLS